MLSLNVYWLTQQGIEYFNSAPPLPEEQPKNDPRFAEPAGGMGAGDANGSHNIGDDVAGVAGFSDGADAAVTPEAQAEEEDQEIEESPLRISWSLRRS